MIALIVGDEAVLVGYGLALRLPDAEIREGPVDKDDGRPGALFDEECLPMDDEETRVRLLRGLRHKLQSFQVGPERRTVLVVKSIGLLARYHAGVRDFYEWFCGDFAMVVLILDGLPDERVWPEDVACDADRLLKYFHEPGVVKQVFGEKW